MFNLNPYTMKKFKILALALLLGVATSFAANTVENPNKELHKAITELLKSSEMIMSTDVIEVEVTFTLNSECEVVVLGVNSTDVNVKNYIRENLNYKKLCFEAGQKDKLYKIPLKFVK